jgi:hypothetical protein
MGSERYKRPDPPRGIQILDVLEPGKAWLVDRIPSTVGVKNWSRDVDGVVYRSDRCLTHRCGQHTEHYLCQYVSQWDEGVGAHADLDVLADLQKNRATAQKLMDREDVKWTYSSLAHQITSWLGVARLTQHSKNAFLPQYHFTLCRPGEYEGQIALWDMSGAYWHFLSRLPHPWFEGMWLVGDEVEIRTNRGGPQEVEARWWEFVSQPWTKSMKVRWIGTNAAGWGLDNGPTGSCVAFWRGEPYRMPDWPGPLQSLALCCVRLCYELCQMAALEEDAGGETALYANSDCVIRWDYDGQPPQIWRDLGVPSRCKARGEGALITSIGHWQVGNVMTGHMANDLRNRMTELAEPVEPRLVVPSAYRILATGEEEAWRQKMIRYAREDFKGLRGLEQIGRCASPGGAISSMAGDGQRRTEKGGSTGGRVSASSTNGCIT